MFSIDSLRNDSFTWQTASSLALASKLSYEWSSTIQNVTVNGWGFKQCQSFGADTQGFIAIGDDVIIVAFRGTESIGDWLDSLNVLPENRPYGKVHSGFIGAFQVVEQDIRSALPTGSVATRKVWMTGHSLGGALATVAAAELKDVLPITGIYTYGQPRLGNEAVRSFFKSRYPNRFMRFVNDNDIVPRVPPGYQHVGQLVDFDSSGNVSRPTTEAEAEATEPPPLTEEQFNKLQSEIRKVKTELRQLGRSEREAVLDATVEGLFPGLGDHRIDRCIALIRRQTSGTSMDSLITVERSQRAAMEAVESAGGPAASRRSTDAIPVLLRVKDANWAAPAGLHVGSRIGNILSAQSTIDALTGLESDPGVESIEVSRDSGVQELATSVPFVGADRVHRPPIAEEGDMALIGIIDTGIDVLHEAFRDADGTTRIVAVWDQRDNAVPSPNSPNALDAAHFKHPTGTLYLANQIQRFIDGTETTPAALRDPQKHGTHVASIAAGRSTGVLADGMAPKARIVVVIPKMRTSQGDPFSVGYSNSHFDALTFLKCVAEGGSKVSNAALPMAVNVSLGMNAGAHDGSSLLEAGFDSITNKGQDPGFVIVKSAGNERGFGGHARVQAFPGITPIQWQSDNMFRFQDSMELWYQPFDELEFTLADPAGNNSAIVSRHSSDVNQPLGGNACHLVLTERHKDNGDNRLVITIVPQKAAIQQGLWTLNVSGINVRSRGQVDIWVERDDSARAVRFVPEVPETTLSIPGTADTVITVAACHAAEPLQLVPSSSFGLTRKGGPKPDVCAPGFNIIAAEAAGNDHSAAIAMTGTSMAAPHVTGALALVMSHRHKQPGRTQHNAQQLRSATNRTVKHFSLHHPGVGYGMLDAKALFDDLLT
jgi:subtilisin family serine protease